MKKNARDIIIDFLEKKDYSPSDLEKASGISRTLIHRYLKDLCEDGYIERIGSAPKSSYHFLRRPPIIIKSPLIKKQFIFKDSTGKVHTGIEAFMMWSENALKKYTLQEKVSMYEKSMQELSSMKNASGVFPLDAKLEEFHTKTGEGIYIESLSSAFLYSLHGFGRTREATLLDIAKEGSERNMKFGNQLLTYFLSVLFEYLQHHHFDAVAFIPPSASRKVQIISLLRERFSNMSSIPIIGVRKKHGEVTQQQKHLKGIMERLENANRTLYISPTEGPYETVLLIDDLIGSCATINQVAKKFVTSGIAKNVHGIGIIGIKSGFEVVKKT